MPNQTEDNCAGKLGTVFEISIRFLRSEICYCTVRDVLGLHCRHDLKDSYCNLATAHHTLLTVLDYSKFPDSDSDSDLLSS